MNLEIWFEILGNLDTFVGSNFYFCAEAMLWLMGSVTVSAAVRQHSCFTFIIIYTLVPTHLATAKPFQNWILVHSDQCQILSKTLNI